MSPLTEYPGVYVEEYGARARPIEGVGTSTAAFVGLGPGGPVRRVRSFADFERKFDASSALGDAVHLFFANGGRHVWVAGDLDALDAVPELALLALPAETDPEVLGDALAYAEKRRAFLLVDAPENNADGAVAIVEKLRPRGSSYGAVYFPWLVAGPRRRSCAPKGSTRACS